MMGTFLPGDWLYVKSIPFSSLHIGDIVVYYKNSEQKSQSMIVHRVRSKSVLGVRTQGDASTSIDPSLVSSQALLGRVEFVRRSNSDKYVCVWNGWRGQMRAISLQLIRQFVEIGRYPYRALRASGLFQRLAAPFVSKVAFSIPEGPCIKYLLLGRSVATWQPAQGRFTCRKPFDLFIKPPG